MALLASVPPRPQAQSPATRSAPISQEGSAFGPWKRKRQIRRSCTTRQVPRPPPWDDPGSGGLGLKTQAMGPRRVMLEPKRRQHMYVVASWCIYMPNWYVSDRVNLRSFLGSPNQCDPGASLSKTIGDQGIQEAKLMSRSNARLNQSCSLLHSTWN